ncbi:MAG TPA: monovalent cation/H(+) antiporter subunit G [Acidimicrobiales bacterium]|nr:monovalent cation/H(+) antiporter subunit G [Acidimicrobiales bacterium]
MSHAFVVGLLVFGCACEMVCVAGMLWMRQGFDQLHFTGAASTVGVLAFGVAVVIQGFSTLSGTIECVIALALTFLLNPVMATATARAGRRLRYETLEPRPEEFEQQP